jgi:predicted aconitase with swiveling domain
VVERGTAASQVLNSGAPVSFFGGVEVTF